MAAAAAAAASSSSVSSLTTTHALHRFLRPPPSFFRPLSAASVPGKPHFSVLRSSNHLHNTPISPALFPNFLHSTSSRSFPTSPLNSPPNALNPSISIEEEIEYDSEGEEIGSDVEDRDSESELESELEDNPVSVSESDESPKQGLKREGLLEVPKLTVKEKKELASYAHGLGKKLKSQLVGKSGVTDNVATSFVETLEANELLKIKIHGTCPGELEEVVQRLEESTGSVVVSKIGRTVIIYRPSISKMKAEEKKNQERRVYVRKDSKFNPGSQRGQVKRLTGRVRR